MLLIHHNPKTVATIKRNGVQLREKSGKILRAHLNVKQFMTKDDKTDLVLLTVKSFDTRSAAESLRRVLPAKTPILSLQNGLGNIDTLIRKLPRSTILAGVTTEPALLNRTGFVKHPGSGVTWIGDLRRRASGISSILRQVFRRAGFRTEVMGDIEGAIWAKAIVNSAINPISALARVANVDILRTSYLRQAALMLLREGVAVAKASGISPSPAPESLFLHTLESTGANRSSMLRDIESGRRTEIRELNGTIACYGKRLGVAVPVNSLITSLVLGLERSSAKFSPPERVEIKRSIKRD